MSVYQRTARAEEDLIEIWTYIALDSVVAADKILDEIEARCVMLANNPLMGRLRPDIAPELRSFVSGAYLILYLFREEGIQVVRFVHGARDLSRI